MHATHALRSFGLIPALILMASPLAADSDELFDHELRRLHSSEVVNLRESFAGHPLLIINTASHCGFTGQFSGLEELHQQYQDAGLKVVLAVQRIDLVYHNPLLHLIRSHRLSSRPDGTGVGGTIATREGGSQ
jgi:hypothetical protein